jgi:hypothetical protein
MEVRVATGDGGFYHWLQLPEGMNAAVEGIIQKRIPLRFNGSR